jgi:radical SAM protein with 4Fe4S-binding SPASM domain
MTAPGRDKPAPPDGPPLRLLFWETTARCNLACVHCRRLDAAEAAARDDLTTDQAAAMLDSAAKLGRPIIVFSGGEPLTRPDWPELASHARGLGLITALATNATLVDDAMAARIAAADFHRVSISFDGADAATHDSFRGVGGSFQAARAGAARLRARGVRLQVNTTIAAHNAHQLDDLLALAREIDAEAMHLFLLVPVGCGVEIGPSHQLSPARYEQVLDWVCDRIAQQPPLAPHQRPRPGQLELKATCAPHFYRLAAQRGLSVGHGKGCLCGRSVVFVSHSGEVFPCGYLPVSCGNVKQTPLEETWRRSDVLADLRDPSMLGGKCGRCDYKLVCGGCRARAYALTGDYLAAEPQCGYQPPTSEH